MQSTTRNLLAAGLAVMLTVGFTPSGSLAGPVPNAWSVAAGTVGYVPASEDIQKDFQLLSGPADNVATAKLDIEPVFTGPIGTEKSRGAAEAVVNTTDFNLSSLRARSSVSTGQFVSDTPNCLCFANTSVAALGAAITNPLGGGSAASLTLHIGGSLTLTKDADDPALFDDMVASVYVSLALADASSTAEDALDLFVNAIPDGEIVYGLAALAWVPDDDNPGLTKAELYTEGVFNDAIVTGVGDERGGPCTANFCKMLIELTLTISDVQLLGIGEDLAVGLLLATDAYQYSAPGRQTESDFFNTATLGVTFLPTVVPVPGALLLLCAGLLGLAAFKPGRGRR